MNKRYLLPLALLGVLVLVFGLSRRERAAPASSRTGMPAAESTLRPSTALPPPAGPVPRDTGAGEALRREPAVHGRTAEAATAGDPLLAALATEMRFRDRVRAAREASSRQQVAEGRRLLLSGDAEDRALGGILLFLNRALSPRDLHAIAGDERLLVPLAVYDWVRDFGSGEEIASFAAALSQRDVSAGELEAFLAESASAPGGGRSALDLLLPRFGGEELAEGLAEIVAAGQDANRGR